MNKLVNVVGLMLISSFATFLNAAEIEVKMLNKGSDGEKMVFEPALIVANVGDTVTFLPTDKGHMAASIKGMIPDGAKKFKGKTNKKVSYVVESEGLYGVRCTPHYANGMVAIIAVGSGLDKDAFLEGKKVSKKAKVRFQSMLDQL